MTQIPASGCIHIFKLEQFNSASACR